MGAEDHVGLAAVAPEDAAHRNGPPGTDRRAGVLHGGRVSSGRGRERPGPALTPAAISGIRLAREDLRRPRREPSIRADGGVRLGEGHIPDARLTADSPGDPPAVPRSRRGGGEGLLGPALPQGARGDEDAQRGGLQRSRTCAGLSRLGLGLSPQPLAAWKLPGHSLLPAHYAWTVSTSGRRGSLSAEAEPPPMRSTCDRSGALLRARGSFAADRSRPGVRVVAADWLNDLIRPQDERRAIRDGKGVSRGPACSRFATAGSTFKSPRERLRRVELRPLSGFFRSSTRAARGIPAPVRGGRGAGGLPAFLRPVAAGRSRRGVRAAHLDQGEPSRAVFSNRNLKDFENPDRQGAARAQVPDAAQASMMGLTPLLQSFRQPPNGSVAERGQDPAG